MPSLQRLDDSMRTAVILSLLPLTACSSSLATSAAAEANEDCVRPSISADGRLVVFDSRASNLVPDDTNDKTDVFVHDRQTGTTLRVSGGAGGQQADDESWFSRISGDGQYVVFESHASNLVVGDTNGVADVFVHDRASRRTTRVSVDSAGMQADGESRQPSISADGRFVAFQSVATNLVPDDTNRAGDVFLHDRQTGKTVRASVASTGAQANAGSGHAALSDDGTRIAFVSHATNLAPDDTNGHADIFLHDVSNGTTTCLSHATGGTGANAASDQPAISADGQWVAFESWASNLVAGDANGQPDVFLRDVAGGATLIVSARGGESGNNHSRFPTVSSDGSLVVFETWTTNLVPRDPSEVDELLLYDRASGQLARVSSDPEGRSAKADSGQASFAAQRRTVVFASKAANLVAGDRNRKVDIFVRDLAAGRTERVSIGGLASW